ncbi:MAG: aminopeptidase N [Betaproteobacteria bacterium]|nr:aminopeptidase N [Betaproteobacteria bacterium]
MKTATPIRREDYEPPSHTLSALVLEFDLDLDQTLVTAEFSFWPNPAGPSKDLTLAGEDLQLVGAWLDGRPMTQGVTAGQYALSEEGFRLRGVPQGRLRLQTRISPSANTQLMGLYASQGGLYTQCESEGFRRICFFQDRPDTLAVYTVSLRAPSGQFSAMLSNGNLVSDSTLDGVRTCVWHDPFPKPSYLFALVAANLSCIEESLQSRSGKTKRLQVYTRADDRPRAGFAMQSLKRAIQWDERRYGLELDLDQFMIVAVPDFNSGAMENKGLNLFNTRFVLADAQTATDRDYELIEAVTGHEYFHNWTGNRITCRDWFQLTLKEGLTVFRDQEFSADMLAEGLSKHQAASARAVKRIDDVRTLRAHQFPEDAGPMAHPIRPSQYQEIRNFYTATVYEKGAEVIRLLQTLFGPDGFRGGMDLYVARHDGKAATCEDFVSAILDANGASHLFPIFMRWYDTLGTPSLHVEDAWDAQTGHYSITLRQALDPRSSQKDPLIIPVGFGLLANSPAPIKESVPSLLLLEHFEQTFTFHLPSQIHQGAPVPSLLRDFSAPVSLHYDYTEEQLSALAQCDSDPFQRWEACQRLMLSFLIPQSNHTRPDATTLDTLAAVLRDSSLSDAFKAQALTLPPETVVAEAWAAQGLRIDPLAIHSGHLSLRRLLASHLEEDLRSLDAELDLPASPYQFDSMGAGWRALRHLAQSLLNLIETSRERADLLLERFERADNMTTRMATLQGLVALGGPASEQALKEFAQQFERNPLAMDKWFSVQVVAERIGDDHCLETLGVVEHLLADDRYDAHNPNRVRAVLGAFFMQASAGLHREDGHGYALWARELASLDQRNGQLAARLARSLDRWSCFEPTRRDQMRGAIERLAAGPTLSRDLAEVCERFLTTAA